MLLATFCPLHENDSDPCVIFPFMCESPKPGSSVGVGAQRSSFG